MTTIAAFATFTTPANDQLQKKLSSIHVLADSKWSWVSGKSIDFDQKNTQKIFFNKEAGTIIAYSGEAETGFLISSSMVSTISINAAIRVTENIEFKISEINKGLNIILAKIPTQKRKGKIELLVVTHCNNLIHAYKFIAKPDEVEFDLRPIEISNQVNIYNAGSGAEGFLKMFDDNKLKYSHIQESAIYFKSFIDFLKSNKDPFSSLPCQAVVINIDGNVKPVSIKHTDNFYLMGDPHIERANFKHEVDYRDEDFEFLHADGRIKGNNRKKYNF